MTSLFHIEVECTYSKSLYIWFIHQICATSIINGKQLSQCFHSLRMYLWSATPKDSHLLVKQCDPTATPASAKHAVSDANNYFSSSYNTMLLISFGLQTIGLKTKLFTGNITTLSDFSLSHRSVNVSTDRQQAFQIFGCYQSFLTADHPLDLKCNYKGICDMTT